MLGLAGSFSYTSRVSFSEESLLHSPCCFQWAVLGTMMFNHACMRHVSSSERHHTIDVVECHVGRHNSYSHCDISLRERRKVTAKERQRQGLSGYSAPRFEFRAPHEVGFVGCHRNDVAKHGPFGAQRPPTHLIWFRLSIDWNGSEQT